MIELRYPPAFRNHTGFVCINNAISPAEDPFVKAPHTLRVSKFFPYRRIDEMRSLRLTEGIKCIMPFIPFPVKPPLEVGNHDIWVISEHMLDKNSLTATCFACNEDVFGIACAGLILPVPWLPVGEYLPQVDWG